MKFYGFFVLMLATVLVGKVYGCNFQRLPRYKDITQPTRILSVPQAHGICVASDGKFAVVPWNTNGKFHLFYGSGRLMEIVRLPHGHRSYLGDCTFSGSNLYVTGHSTKKIYKFTENGKFLEVIASGESFLRITSRQGQLYATVYHRNSRNVVSYCNDKETHRFNVPGIPHGIVVGTDENIYVSTFNNKVLSFAANGKLLRTKTYKELGIGDGMAMDKAGNILITDRSRPTELLVYSQCGELIKCIRAGFQHVIDVDIGNDGTVMAADLYACKVYMY